MKAVLLLFCLLIYDALYSQNIDLPEIKTGMQNVIPPSPTVAALMKFNEIPVNNYTGIPDIKIPIYSSSTRDKGITVDIQLKYHPTDIQLSNISSWTGTGWSLIAGGVISRTVKGEADENLIYSKGVYGVDNDYDQLFYDDNGNFIYSDLSYDRQNFLFDVEAKGLHETQYDVYSFNFNGFQGSFYINKEGEIIKLYNNLAIEIDYNSQLKVFTLYDDKGFKYVFNEREVTAEYRQTYNHLRTGTINIPQTPQSPSFVSAFHLSSIHDNNNNLLVKYNYDTINEEYDNKTITYNHAFLLGNNLFPFIECGSLLKVLPYNTLSVSSLSINTKKISSIEIEGKSKIYFTSESGRMDLNHSSVRLKEIEIKDWYGNRVKKIKLTHSYLGEGKRLVLNKVSEINNSDNNELNTNLYYNNIELLPNRDSKFKDAWGYYNGSVSQNREVSEQYCTTGLLQKMTLPTGGCYIFDFESNSYSYTGDEAHSVFINDKNLVDKSRITTYVGYSSENYDEYMVFYLSHNQIVNFTIETLNNPIPVENKKFWEFHLIPIVLPEPPSSGQGALERIFGAYQTDSNRFLDYIKLQEIDPTLNSNVFGKSMHLKKGYYLIRFLQSNEEEMATSAVNYKFKADYKGVINTYKYIPGGGVRIKYVGYFKDDNVSQTYYKDLIIYQGLDHGKPDFEKKIDYNFFNDPNRSSGSLAFQKPLFSYLVTKEHLVDCENSGTISQFPQYATFSIDYEIETDYNNLSVLKTHGSDIGYQNVTIFSNIRDFNVFQNQLETIYVPFDSSQNGRVEYTYTSPIDFPELYIDMQPPFTATRNLDYKRGLLSKERLYDNSNRIVKETDLAYSILDDTKIYGINTFNVSECTFFELYNHLYNYVSSIGANSLNCGYPIHPTIIDFRPLYYSFGWSKLTNKINKQYFYNGGTQSIVQTNDLFTYNPINKQISSHTTTNSTGDILTTNYFYHTGNSPFSQNRISEIERIETKKGSDVLSENKINYSKLWSSNQSYLPQTIEAKKGQSTSEVRLRCTDYDKFGNPIQVQQENGTPITYIWGYYQTQLIAKIENVTYMQVQQYESNLQTLSNGTDEQSLISALNNLRTALPNAMVTTYTYKPLIGVSTITDPKGQTTTYEYDEFNRLKLVKDHQGNILNENKYHYRTQN